MHRAGRPGVVHLVEALHGLVLVVLAPLQQVVHGHCAAVVVYVVAALAVGEDLDPLDETGGVRSGRRQRVGGVSVSDSEGDRLGVNERGTAGQRDAADPRGGGGEGAKRAGEILHVVPRGHVVGVAGFQLVVQALHQLILCSGCDYLHASLQMKRIFTRTAKKATPPGRLYENSFLSGLDVPGQLVVARRRQAALAGLPGAAGACPGVRLELRQSHWVQVPGEGTWRVVGLRLDSERLRGGTAACGAAGSAAARAQRKVLTLRGIVHAVGGPAVLHGCVLTALLRPEERVLQHPARAPGETVGRAACESHGQPRRCRCADSWRGSQRPSNLARSGREGCDGLRCAPLHLLRTLPRLVQEALDVVGLTYDLRRRLWLRTWAGHHAQARVLGCVLGSWERKACAAASPAAPAPTRSAAKEQLNALIDDVVQDIKVASSRRNEKPAMPAPEERPPARIRRQCHHLLEHLLCPHQRCPNILMTSAGLSILQKVVSFVMNLGFGPKPVHRNTNADSLPQEALLQDLQHR